MDSVRWNVSVSADTDQSVRMFIAAEGGGRKGDLSRFIEEAVRSYLLEKAVEQAKSAATGIGETELTELIEEAVDMARGQVRTGYPFHAQYDFSAFHGIGQRGRLPGDRQSPCRPATARKPWPHPDRHPGHLLHRSSLSGRVLHRCAGSIAARSVSFCP